jgi:hypothetical protein
VDHLQYPTRSALMPSNEEFEVNEAWIVFRLNGLPIQTAQDGSLNCMAIMDAASGFILGSELVAVDAVEISQLEAKRLLAAGKIQTKMYPSVILIPVDFVADVFTQQALRQGIQVKRVPERELLPFIDEARVGFEQFRMTLPK